MTSLEILVWLVACPLHLDGHAHPIPRPYGAAKTIADVAATTEAPQTFAALLDVLAAHESAYHTGVTGDGGRSCGAWQTPCAETPPDGLGQAKLALKILRRANNYCPVHAVWLYASGRCVSTQVARFYEREVRAMFP